MTEIYCDTLRVSWWRSTSRIGTRSGLGMIATRIIWVMARMVGPYAERTTMDESKLVVGQVNMLKALAHKGIAIYLVDVAVAQVKCDNVIISITEL